jgi:hypothetical protein
VIHAAYGNLHSAHLDLQYSQQINRLLLNIAPVNLRIAAMKKRAHALCEENVHINYLYEDNEKNPVSI